MQDKKIVTIKKAAELTGASNSFIRQLLGEGKLKRYKINSATYISLVEFEELAQPAPEDINAHNLRELDKIKIVKEAIGRNFT